MKRKKGICILCSLILLLALLSGCGNNSSASASAPKGDGKKPLNWKQSIWTVPAPDEMPWPDATDSDVGQEDIPAYYLGNGWQEPSDAQYQGTLAELTYVSSLTSISGDPEEKRVNIYLPYGYTPEKKYDVLYIMHGMGASNTTFLGENGEYDGGLKKVLDYAIEQGKIKPLIVVAPDLGNVSDYDENRLDALCLEIRTIVMPLVESTYSTYAESTDYEGLTASRDHRAFGGFSMGGCITWRMLWNYTEYFRYYIPCSMIVDFDLNGDVPGETYNMVSKLQYEGYTWKDYSVYCATGSEDYTSGMVNLQVQEFEKYPDQFKEAEDGFENGNLMFRVWKGRTHHFYLSFDYFYNALMLFFPGDGVDMAPGDS
jgi:enterochelin esterase-like enzyme